MATTTSSRPPTNGTTRSSSSVGRRPSLSSFPSRTPSNQSLQNGTGRLPLRKRHQNGSQSSAQTSQSHGSNNVFLPTKHVRKLRSQYPADSTERHVEYILVASFDIDKGSIMEHQFPGPISGDEGMLAELMLPDQAHMRSEDWTIFFLHKDTSEEEEAREERRMERRRRREDRATRQAALDRGESVSASEAEEESLDESEEDDEGGEGPPLIYVLNLVNTKQDTTARRGAVCKAMAICTRHPFLHIYKPLLLLALGEYFKSPDLHTLEQLYESVNSMDLSLMPRLSTMEKTILQASETKDLFIEKFEQMIRQRSADDRMADSLHTDSPSKHGRDASTRYQKPRDTHEYETRVIYNSIPIPIKVPTAVSPETVGDFSLVKLIQTFSTQHTSTPQPFALHPELTTNGAFTHPILVLINAILTQKRVIFLGHNRPSGEVAEAVLAACALVSGSILRGFTRHAFPYTDLTKIDDLLNVPGFIAGVTNPTFANHPEWWDLLCDIPTGRMKISSRIEPAPPSEGLSHFQQQHPLFAPSNTGVLPPAATSSATGPATGPGSASDPNGDVAFMDDILRSIAARHGEPALRSKFRDYISKFTRLAAAYEEAVFGATTLYIGADEADSGDFGISGHGYVWADETSRARELAANVWRIEGWRQTRSYYALIQDIAVLWARKPIRSIDVEHHLDRLRASKLSVVDGGLIYKALNMAVTGHAEINQLLAATPENHNGLFYLGLGLFHTEREVRIASAELLERIRGHEAGRHFWNSLAKFIKVQFLRVWREMDGQREEDTVLSGLVDGAGAMGFMERDAASGSGGTNGVHRPKTRGRE